MSTGPGSVQIKVDVVVHERRKPLVFRSHPILNGLHHVYERAA